MAELGFRVTATDVSPYCLAQAGKNAEKSGTSVEFIRDNALHTSLARKFDIIVDRGCFAGQNAKFYNDYVENVAKLIKPDGHYLLTVPSGNEKPKLALLAERFATVRVIKSFYLGPQGEKWDTLFIHLRPLQEGFPISAPESPE
jgi:2-polyprenyl-3-methyl-5-hydroxy-6-metoxy-1,4-benzoquinol methylase